LAGAQDILAGLRRFYARRVADPGVFVDAAKTGDMKTLRRLVAWGIRVNRPANDEYQITALYAAAAHGQEEALRYLLSVPGIRVNMETASMGCALHGAVREGNASCIKILMDDPRTNPNAIHKSWGYGETPLTLAMSSQNLDLIEAVLAHPQTNPNLSAERLNTPLCLAVKTEPPFLPGIRLLLANPRCDVNAASPDGDTALHMAARFGTREAMEALLERSDLLPLALNDTRQTALNEAVRQNRNDCAQLLLERGPEAILLPDILGRTPLHYAAENHNPRLCSLLIGMGSDIEAEDNNGKNPLDLAGPAFREANEAMFEEAANAARERKVREVQKKARGRKRPSSAPSLCRK